MNENQNAEEVVFEEVERVARTFVREGSLLYPYRRDAQKNRFGWHFGSLLPPSYCVRADAGDRSWIQTECLIESDFKEPQLHAKIKFLQVSDKDLIERDVAVSPLFWGALRVRPAERHIKFPEMEAVVHVGLTPVREALYRVTVRVLNLSAFDGNDREEAMNHTLISTHILLRIENGRFHSMIDPPRELEAETAGCENVGVWPVLAGSKGCADQILSSPFILYDYPALAPESPTDFFDCTEIDELLTLRLLTLTPTEKEALRISKEGAGLLAKAEGIFEKEDFLNLHGAFRERNGHPLRAGDRVRLKPKRRADILDVILTGKTAMICSVEHDISGRVFACVTIDDDPGKDLGHLGQPGHRFFFELEEMERL